jgi:hypothetical protein
MRPVNSSKFLYFKEIAFMFSTGSYQDGDNIAVTTFLN